MASNSDVHRQVQQQQQLQLVEGQQQDYEQENKEEFTCKDCCVPLDSDTSFNIHMKYHHKNTLVKHWINTNPKESNNNSSKPKKKRELIPNNTVSKHDSSDSVHKKSPEYSRTTPETIFGEPPTPQSYHSSSPYQNQNQDNSNFTQNFSNFQPKNERISPNLQQQQQQQLQFQQNSFSNYSDAQYFPIDSDQNQSYSESYHPPSKNNHRHNSSYRYHPYGEPHENNYDRQQAQVSNSNPVYPPQPTPSPSPKQCDKCGLICRSASELMEHILVHSPNQNLTYQQPNQHFLFDQPPIKQEDNAQSEILDLDSHKVVHNVFPEEEKLQNGNPIVQNPHSVSSLLHSWNPAQQATQQQQQKIYQQQEQRMFMDVPEQKMFTQSIPDNKMFSTDQKLFQPQMHNPDYMVNGVATSSQENNGSNINNLGQPHQGYRPFEHLTAPTNTPVISSTQVPNTTQQPPMQKSSNWKSNEARRPKTYNCTACNKWFTSSGHLKRHYNTTLHKNAVKSSGQPDPASLPISAHHHPARESSSTKQDERPQSGSSGDEIRSEDNSNMTPQFDRLGAMPGLMQQPSSSPYDRQPVPNIHHPPSLHTPMTHVPMPQHSGHLVNPGLPNLSNGSPPNGEAGLSTNNVDSRGLPSLNTTHINTHGFNMAPQHMMSMENNQFQMYPNESAPHVTQVMHINNHNTTGEYQFTNESIVAEENQPLPSFAQIHRYGLIGYDIANVGGGGAATTPYATYYIQPNDAQSVVYNNEESEEYKLTAIRAANTSVMQADCIIQYTPNQNNNNDIDNFSMISMDIENEPNFQEESKIHIVEDIKLRLEPEPDSPEKAHVKRDYEENTGNPLISSTVPTKSGLHKCFDCDKIFNKACYLTQHNKTFHSGDKPYKCTRCGKRFSSDTVYQEHLKKHAGDKPHKCELCPKQFNHKTDLRRHMCLHTGNKPYICKTCNKGFIRKDHMVKHIDTHLRKTQSKLGSMR